MPARYSSRSRKPGTSAVRAPRVESTLPAVWPTDHRPVLAGDDGRGLMPRVCAASRLMRPVRAARSWALARRAGKATPMCAVQVARASLMAGTRSVSPDTRERDRTCRQTASFMSRAAIADVGLLLLPAVPNRDRRRAPHLPSLELTEDGLDTRCLKRVEVPQVTRDRAWARRLHVSCQRLKYTTPATSQRPGTACSNDEQSASRSSQRSERRWPRSHFAQRVIQVEAVDKEDRAVDD